MMRHQLAGGDTPGLAKLRPTEPSRDINSALDRWDIGRHRVAT